MKSTLSKADTLKALDSIKEMTDETIRINPEWIRKIAESAYCHVKRKG